MRLVARVPGRHDRASYASSIAGTGDGRGRRRNARDAEALEDEQYVVVKSIEYTFKDVHRLLGGLARGRYRSRREAYRSVWQKLDDFFYDESRNHLVDRLHYYKLFVLELTNLVVG